MFRCLIDHALGSCHRAPQLCAALLVALVSVGCVFDDSGVGTVKVPPDATVDTSSDAKPDLGQDSGVDAMDGGEDSGPVCAPDASAEEQRCFFSDTDDAVGRAGFCAGSSFVPARHCFPDAPCVSGVCTASTCDPCQSDQDCDDACTLLFVPNVGIELCCAAKSANAGGDVTTTCNDGTSCFTGLCTVGGFCFEPCINDDQCLTDRCGQVKVPLAGVERTRLGCLPPLPADGGTDATLDAGVDAAVDAGIDAAVDTGVDAAVDAGDASVDAGIDAAIDAKPDAAGDATSETSADSATDSDVDASAEAGTDAASDTTADAASDATSDASADTVADGG